MREESQERAFVSGDDLAEGAFFVIRRDTPHLAHGLLIKRHEQELVLRVVAGEAVDAAGFSGFPEGGEGEDSGEETGAGARFVQSGFVHERTGGERFERGPGEQARPQGGVIARCGGGKNFSVGDRARRGFRLENEPVDFFETIQKPSGEGVHLSRQVSARGGLVEGLLFSLQIDSYRVPRRAEADLHLGADGPEADVGFEPFDEGCRDSLAVVAARLEFEALAHHDDGFCERAAHWPCSCVMGEVIKRIVNSGAAIRGC